MVQRMVATADTGDTDTSAPGGSSGGAETAEERLNMTVTCAELKNVDGYGAVILVVAFCCTAFAVCDGFGVVGGANWAQLTNWHLGGTGQNFVKLSKTW